jgi:hypothetical protein
LFRIVTMVLTIFSLVAGYQCYGGTVFFLVPWGGVKLIPLGMSATIQFIVSARDIVDDECGAVDGMKLGRGNRSTRRKPAPVLFGPPQIPHDLTWARIQAAAV